MSLPADSKCMLDLLVFTNVPIFIRKLEYGPVRLGAPVAQWAKRWPIDLVVPSSSPARGEFFNRKRGSIAQSLLRVFSSAHRPDMTEIC